MLLFLCLWQQNLLQSILAFLSWSILHVFFTVSLGHITLTGHAGHCCQSKGARIVGPCKQRMIDSVRALLDLTHSLIIPCWAAFLLAAGQHDVESHAFLYLACLGYNVYALYWALKEFAGTRHRSFPYFLQHDNPNPTGKNRLLHLTQCFLTAAVVATSIRALSTEMTHWRNSVVPLMMDMHPSSSWNHPTNVQRKALSHHLLGKPSDIAWILTLNLFVHEFPNIFFNFIKLLKLSNYTSNQIQQSAWTTNDYPTDVEQAGALGISAWRRERGGIATEREPIIQKTMVEGFLSKLHRFTFVLVRIIGGFIALNRILMTEALVRDTGYVASALLLHGLAIYFFGGIVSYTAKMGGKRAPTKGISWQLATAVNDDWLR